MTTPCSALLILAIGGVIGSVDIYSNYSCNYVRYTSPVKQAQFVAVDVCRTIVTSGHSKYKKYVCDGSTIKDIEYDNSECIGDPINITTPTVEASKCDGDETCRYQMLKTPCSGDPDTYTIEPALVGFCIGNEFDNRRYSYKWNCNTEYLHFQSVHIYIYIYLVAINDH